MMATLSLPVTVLFCSANGLHSALGLSTPPAVGAEANVCGVVEGDFEKRGLCLPP